MLMASDLTMRLAGFGLRTGLLVTVVTGTVMSVFGTPETIKQAARDSRVYEAMTTMIGDEAPDGGGSDSAVASAIRTAAAESFAPANLQTYGERMLDGTYRWLDGTTPQPDFRVDLTPAANTFMTTLSTQATTFARSLPACTPEQLRETDPLQASIFDLGCLPPGLSPEAASDQAVNKARASHPLLKEPVLTADTLRDAKSGPLHERFAVLPAVYQAVRFSLWISAAVSLICLIVLYMGHRHVVRATYHVARIMFWTGLTVFVTAGLAHVLFAIFTQPGTIITESMSGTAQAFVLAFVRELEWALSGTLLLYSGALLATGGVIALIFRSMIRERSHYAADIPAAADTAGSQSQVIDATGTALPIFTPQQSVPPTPQAPPAPPVTPATTVTPVAPVTFPAPAPGAEAGRTITPTDPQQQ